jgi:hypothetical protein
MSLLTLLLVLTFVQLQAAIEEFDAFDVEQGIGVVIARQEKAVPFKLCRLVILAAMYLAMADRVQKNHKVRTFAFHTVDIRVVCPTDRNGSRPCKNGM